VTDYGCDCGCGFRVEAVPEKIEIKRAVLGEADSILRPEVIIASNTSSISMTTLGIDEAVRPFCGMHFIESGCR